MIGQFIGLVQKNMYMYPTAARDQVDQPDISELATSKSAGNEDAEEKSRVHGNKPGKYRKSIGNYSKRT
jgi:hypothetical protein